MSLLSRLGGPAQMLQLVRVAHDMDGRSPPCIAADSGKRYDYRFTGAAVPDIQLASVAEASDEQDRLLNEDATSATP